MTRMRSVKPLRAMISGGCLGNGRIALTCNDLRSARACRHHRYQAAAGADFQHAVVRSKRASQGSLVSHVACLILHHREMPTGHLMTEDLGREHPHLGIVGSQGNSPRAQLPRLFALTLCQQHTGQTRQWHWLAGYLVN